MVGCRTHTRAAAGGIRNIGEIADLSLSQVYLGIDQEQLAGDGAEDERIGNGTANLADADNPDPRDWLGVFGGHVSAQVNAMTRRLAGVIRRGALRWGVM